MLRSSSCFEYNDRRNFGHKVENSDNCDLSEEHFDEEAPRNKINLEGFEKEEEKISKKAPSRSPSPCRAKQTMETRSRSRIVRRGANSEAVVIEKCKEISDDLADFTLNMNISISFRQLDGDQEKPIARKIENISVKKLR